MTTSMAQIDSTNTEGMDRIHDEEVDKVDKEINAYSNDGEKHARKEAATYYHYYTSGGKDNPPRKLNNVTNSMLTNTINAALNEEEVGTYYYYYYTNENEHGSGSATIDAANDADKASHELIEEDFDAYYYYYYTDENDSLEEVGNTDPITDKVAENEVDTIYHLLDENQNGSGSTAIDEATEKVDEASSKVVEEEVDTYSFYYTDENEDGSDNVATDIAVDNTDATPGEIIEEEVDIYYYYYTDGIEDGSDNVATDIAVDTTDATPGEIIEEEVDTYYYYYTDENEDGSDNDATDIPVNNTDATPGEIIEEEAEEEVDTYYYYYTDENEDGSDNATTDIAANNTDTTPDEVNEEDIGNADGSSSGNATNNIAANNTDGTPGAGEIIGEGVDVNIDSIDDVNNITNGKDFVGDKEQREFAVTNNESFLLRRCPVGYLTDSNIDMTDLSFTFVLDVNTTMTDEIVEKARSNLLDHVAENSLVCAEKSGRRLSGRLLSAKPTGIYEIRYLDNEAMKAVSECHQSNEGNSCLIYSGILRLVSDQSITSREQILVSTSIRDYVNSIHTGSRYVKSSVYLGPEILPTPPLKMYGPPLKMDGVEHIAIAMSVSFFISYFLFIAYRRHVSRTRRREVMFDIGYY